MSIKTHYALRQGGEADNGKMTQANSIGINALHYWPMDNSTGTTVDDVGRTGTADMTSTAVTAGTGYDEVRHLTTDTIAADIAAAGTNDFICMAVLQNATGASQLNANLVTGGLVNAIVFAQNASAPLTLNGLGVAADIVTTIDDTPHLYGVVRRGTFVDSYFDGVLQGSEGGIDANMTNPIGLNTSGGSQLKGNVANKAFVYGILYAQFADGLPSNLVAAMNWMKTQWVADNKVLYPGWVTLD